MATQDQKKGKRRKDTIGRKDPTIRQEFPGAETNKKKIEAGIRNVKEEPPSAPQNNPGAPGADQEPVEENSNKIY